MATTELEIFNTGRVPASLPFCSAIRAGDTVYVSGCLGHLFGEQKVVEGGVAAETKQALEHMRDSLEAASSSLDRVVKCLVFLTDMADFETMNQVYSDFFGSHRPARSTVGVAELALGGKFEIECVAMTG